MQRSRFCRQLAELLAATPWHFRTLAAAAIESTQYLPDSASQVLHRLVDAFPKSPGATSIEQYLLADPDVRWWFRVGRPPPRVWQFVFQPIDQAAPRNDLPQVATIGELAAWLRVSQKTLEWLCDSWRIEDPRRPVHYRYVAFEKRRAGIRLLESPKTQLKRVQRALLGAILSKIPASDSAMAYRRGHGILDHARLHVGKRWVVSFDLKNFFPSVPFIKVLTAVHSVGYREPVSNAIALLCTHRCASRDLSAFGLDQDHRSLLRERHLPQGAPTSPALSNLVLRALDRRLIGLARSFELEYSRYADDMVFSGNSRHNWRHMEALVASICLDEGFALNHRKTRIRSSAQQQRVTGVVVNQQLNVPRREFDALKAELHNCVRSGPSSENRRHFADYRAHLLGRIEHMRSINPRKGDRLRKLFLAIDFAS